MAICTGEVEEDRFREHFCKLDIHKSTEPEEINSGGLRQLDSAEGGDPSPLLCTGETCLLLVPGINLPVHFM